MKNFKKVLALVLVLASLLGLATMAGAATEYKDADKINADYTEAIKVLDLIETMQGYPDGNFKPTATITREEAAKVIAIFDNKDADISTYYTSINPFTDEKGRWGEFSGFQPSARLSIRPIFLASARTLTAQEVPTKPSFS